MAAQYPGALAALSTAYGDGTVAATNHKDAHNNANAEIDAIETELGTTPKDVYSDVAARLAALELVAFNVRSLGTYTLVLSDRSKVVSCLNASGTTLTVPTDASVAFPVGTQIAVRQGPAAGTVTVAGAGGVTVLSRGGAVTLAGIGAWASLVKTGVNTWDLVGDIQ